MKNIKTQILSAVLWKFMEQFGTRGLAFIITIILARILSPKEYGTIALIAIFVNIAEIFIQAGFSIALIQKKDADDLDFSSVLYLNIFIALLMYFILFISAPIIAQFYNIKILIEVIRVYSLMFLLSPLKSVQSAIVSRQLNFKMFFYSNIGGFAISGTVGIIMAYSGFGVWALVAQNLTHVFITTIILWFMVKWRPKLIFSFVRIKELFGFGWKIFVSNLIVVLTNSAFGLVIGKAFSGEMLAHYNKGNQFPELVTVSINSTIASILLPVLSKYQNDNETIKKIIRRSIITSCLISFPLLFGLAAVAKPLISILLTEKWLPCVPILQIFCLMYAFRPIATINRQAMSAVGRSDLFLKFEIIGCLLNIIFLIISIPFGIYAVVSSRFVQSLIMILIGMKRNENLFAYSIKEQFKDIIPYLLMAFSMSICVLLLVDRLYINLLTLSFQIMIGVTIYSLLIIVTKIDGSQYIIYSVKQYLLRFKNNRG